MALASRANRRRRALLPACAGQCAPGERPEAHPAAARESHPQLAAHVVLWLRGKRRDLRPSPAPRLLHRDTAAGRGDPDAGLAGLAGPLAGGHALRRPRERRPPGGPPPPRLGLPPAGADRGLRSAGHPAAPSPPPPALRPRPPGPPTNPTPA